MADIYSPEQFLEDMLKIRGGAPAAQLPSSETPIMLPQDKTSAPLAGLLSEDIDRPSLPVEPPTPELGPVQQAFKDVWVGFKQGMYGEADALDMIANLGAKATGLPKGEFFKNMMGKVFTEPGAEDIKPGLGHMVLRGIGAAIPIITEFVVGTKGVGMAMRAAKLPTAVKLGGTAATQGARWLGPQAAALARQQGVKGAIGLATPTYFGAREAGLEAAKGIVEEKPALPTMGKSLLRGAGGVALGGGLEALHPLKAALAVPAGAGMFGTQAAVEQMAAGQPPLGQETISSMLVGGMLVGGPRLLAKPKTAPGERPVNYIKVLDKNNQEINISQEHIDALRHHLATSRGFDPADLQSKPYSELQTLLEGQIYPTAPIRPTYEPTYPGRPFEKFMEQVPKYVEPERQFAEFMKAIPRPEAKSMAVGEKERAIDAREKQTEIQKKAAGQLLGKEYWDSKFKEGSAYLVHLVARGKGGGFKNSEGRYVPSTEQFEMATNKIGIGREDMPKRLEFFTYLSEVAKGTEGKDRNIKKFLLQPAEKKAEAPLVPNATDPDLIKGLEKSEIKITQKSDGTLDVRPTEEAALGQHELMALMRKLDAEDSYLEPSDFKTPGEARAYLDGSLSESDMTARVEAGKRGEAVPEVQAPIEERPTAVPQPRAEYKIGDRISYTNEQGAKFEGTVKSVEDQGVWVQWGGAKGEKFKRLVPWELLEKQVEKVAPPIPTKEAVTPEKPVPVSEEQAFLDQIWEQTKSFAQEREKEALAGGKIGKERIVSEKAPEFPTEEMTKKGIQLSDAEAKELVLEYDKNMKDRRILGYKKKTKKTPEAQKRAGKKIAALDMRNQAINDQLSAKFGMVGTKSLTMEEVRERLGMPEPQEAIQTYHGKPDVGRPSVLERYKPVLDEADIPTRIEDLKYSRKSIMDGILQLPKDSAEYKGLLAEYEAEGRELAELKAGRIPEEQSPYPDSLRAFEEEAADIQEFRVGQAEALRKAQIETTIPEKGKRTTVQIRAEEEVPAKAEPITWEEALKAARGDEDVARSMMPDIEVSKEIKTLKSEMRQADFRIVGELGGAEAYVNYEKNLWAGIDLNTGNWEVKNRNGAVINHGTDTASLFKYLGIKEPVQPQPLPKEHKALVRTHYGPGDLPYTQRTLQAAEQAAERLRRRGNDAYVKQVGKDEFVIEEYGGITTEIRGRAALEKIVGKPVEKGKEKVSKKGEEALTTILGKEGVKPEVKFEDHGDGTVTAFVDVQGKPRAGTWSFRKAPEGGWYSIEADVAPELTRQGIGTTMFDAIQTKYGEHKGRIGELTGAGEKFAEGLQKKGRAYKDIDVEEEAPKEAKIIPMYYKVPAEGVRSDLRAQYPKGTSTLTMIKDGVRTATTRSQPLGKVGDLIKFDNSGDVYRISNIERLPKDIDWSTWSQKEGWDPSYIQKNLSNQVKPGAYQTTFERVGIPKKAAPVTIPEKAEIPVPTITKQDIASWRNKNPFEISGKDQIWRDQGELGQMYLFTSDGVKAVLPEYLESIGYDVSKVPVMRGMDVKKAPLLETFKKAETPEKLRAKDFFDRTYFEKTDDPLFGAEVQRGDGRIGYVTEKGAEHAGVQWYKAFYPYTDAELVERKARLKKGYDPGDLGQVQNVALDWGWKLTGESLVSKMETPTSPTLTVDKEIIKSPEDIENFIKPEPKAKPPAHDADAITKDALAGFQSHLEDLKKVGDSLSLAKDRYLKLGQQSRAAHESLQRDPNNLKIKAAVEDVDKQLAIMAPELQGLTRLMMDMERTAIGGAPKEGYRNEGFYDITDETGRRHQGAVVSNGYEGGATYFLMQGPEGGIPDANKIGNRIAGTAYLVDAKHEGRAALKLEAWDTQEGIHPEVQDRLLNTILTKNLEGTKPKEVVHKRGVADDVWERRKDQGWENAYNAKVRRAIELGAIKEQMGKEESFAENLRQAIALKEKAIGEKELAQAQTVIDGIRIMMDKEAEEAKTTGKPWTKKQRVEYSRAALELNDSIDQHLMDIDYGTAGAKPTKADIVPWLDRYADPSKSSNPTMRRLANYGMQFEMAYKDTLVHYMRLLDTRLGWLRNNPEKSKELMQHLHEIPDETGKPFVSKDPAILQAIADHRMIMDDLAHRFELEKKGLYVKKYATLQWDMEKVWQHFKKPFETTSEYTNLPDNVRAGFEPGHWSELKRIVEQYKDKPWEKVHPDDRTYFINNYLRWSGVFPEWQYLPEDLQQIIPEKKWSPFFQKRTPMGAYLKEVALNEDYFDVTSRYLSISIKGAMTNEFLSRANPLLRTLKFKETKGSWGHMAQEYTRRLAGYGNEGILDTKWKAMANSFNKWLADKRIDHGIPMFLPREFADWYRESLYRGALGPDTAIRNLTQSIYTWADQGTMPLLKGVVNATKAWATKSPEWAKFRESMDLIEENYWNEMANLRKSNPGLYGKIKHINQKITHLALTPLRLTENINKAIAYFAALEKGIADGVDFRTQHLVGLRAASNVVPDFELSEGQWRAWQGMGAGQFLYGKANTSPYMTGTGMSLLTPFWSFPIKSIQFLRNGIKESWISGDKARLTRFMLLSAFMAGAPPLLAATLGVDAYAIWGKGALPIDIMPMWYNTMRDIYISAGGSDFDDEMSKQLARKRVHESGLMMLIPGYRWLKKTGLPHEAGLTDIKGSYQRLQDKYVRWGRTESPMASTNEFKETLSVFGFPSMDRREGRGFLKEAKSTAQEMTYAKSKAMKKMLELRSEGNNQAFLNAWKMAKAQGIDITSTDIDMAQSRRDMDAFTLQARKMPKKVRGEWMARAEEMKKKYLKKGKRSMWVSQETKEPEEGSEE